MTKQERPADGWPWQPSPNRRFFYYDPKDTFFYFATKAERDEAAEKAIDGYLNDNGWNENVTQIVAGELTQVTKQCDVVNRPPDDELDEDGCDIEGTYWDEHEYSCNYRLYPNIKEFEDTE
jgi:hypothetical protein